MGWEVDGMNERAEPSPRRRGSAFLGSWRLGSGGWLMPASSCAPESARLWIAAELALA